MVLLYFFFQMALTMELKTLLKSWISWFFFLVNPWIFAYVKWFHMIKWYLLKCKHMVCAIVIRRFSDFQWSIILKNLFSFCSFGDVMSQVIISLSGGFCFRFWLTNKYLIFLTPQSLWNKLGLWVEN